MLKTKVFTSLEPMQSVFDYEKFIKENQNIEIIAVTRLSHDFILLTYKED